MKRVALCLLLLCLLAGFCCLASPDARAAEHTHHCYCSANGGAEHICEETAAWTAVNSGNSIPVTDGGHYYLEKNMAASITVKSEMTVTLCLNGYSLKAQCPVIVYGGGVLNICDCQGGGYIAATVPAKAKGSVMLISSTEKAPGAVNLYSGTVDGKANSGVYCRAVEVRGGIFNMYGGSIINGRSDGTVATDSRPGCGGNVLVCNNGSHVGSFTLYGGSISGGTASEQGGNVFADQDAKVSVMGGVLEKGTAQYGGNLYYTGALQMENATVREGTAGAQRGNVFIAVGVDMTKNTISGGISGGKPENIRILRNGTTLSTDHASLAGAVEKMEKDNHPEQLHLQLLGDWEEDYTLTGEQILDLNGYTLSGLKVSGKLLGMDTTQSGKLQYTLLGGQVTGLQRDGACYVAAAEADGVSFHLYRMEISHISVVPANAAMGYRTRISGDSLVLEQISRVGYELWLDGGSTLSYSKTYIPGDGLVTLRLKDILSAELDDGKNLEHAQTKVNARPFAILKDGTRLQFSAVSYSFRDAIQGANRYYGGYTAAQRSALQTLSKNYSKVMTGWDVDNFHHVSGSQWTKVNNTSFKTYISRYNEKGNWQGSYALTADLDLGDTTIRVSYGYSLTICLNGHTIRGDQQLFRSSGDLILCDCKAEGHEGSITSTYGDEKKYGPVIHQYQGTLTLYGGNLTAGGRMRSAGVVAVGYPTENESAGTFHMYGGSISGGYAEFNGGLLNIWHGSTFNMYGGSLHDGYCEADGGGLVVRDGSTANLYGGEIYNCHADGHGGGILSTAEGICNLEGVTLRDNTAGKYGGNLYTNNSSVCLDGTTVTGGVAQMGGGVYVHSGQILLSGATVIKGNSLLTDSTSAAVGPDLHLYLQAGANADGLTEGADVNISAANHGKLGTDPAIARYLHSSVEGYTVMKKGTDMVLWNDVLVTEYTVQGFSAGYGKVCINPRELGVPLAGYGDTVNRLSESVDGDLYVTATAITDEKGETVLFLTADLSTINAARLEPILSQVSYYTGVPLSNIIAATSHTHSAPSITASHPTITRYNQLLPDYFTQAAIRAMNDRQPATMYTGSFEVGGGKDGYGLNFTRHYKFINEDGEWEYSCDNFGERYINGKEQVQHVTDVDQTMHLVKFDRAGTDILMINWRAHPTMTGGPNETVLSADYVGALRDAIKKDTGMDVIYFQGASGNVNAVSRLNEEKHGLDFKAYGSALSDQIQSAMNSGCLTRQKAGLWQVDNYSYAAKVDRSDNARYEEAKAFVEEYYAQFPGNQAPQQERLDWCAERGWTCVFEASGIVRRYEKAEDYDAMPLNTLALGSSLAFFTAPGELWDTVSQEVEDTGYFDTVFCVGYSMDSYSYFSYDPDNGGAMQYAHYEGFNRVHEAPRTINDMLAYWKNTLGEMAQTAE